MRAYFMVYNTASHNTIIIQVSAGFHPVGEGVGGGGKGRGTGEKLPLQTP